MLSHFAGDEFAFIATRALDADRVVQRRELAALEAEIHHRAHYLDNLSVAHLRSFLSVNKIFPGPQPLSASAPLTISISSLVM